MATAARPSALPSVPLHRRFPNPSGAKGEFIAGLREFVNVQKNVHDEYRPLFFGYSTIHRLRQECIAPLYDSYILLQLRLRQRLRDVPDAPEAAETAGATGPEEIGSLACDIKKNSSRTAIVEDIMNDLRQQVTQREAILTYETFMKCFDLQPES